MSDPKILALQKALYQLGFDPKGLDGRNGPNTRAAAAAFSRGEPSQKPLELGETGIPKSGQEKLKGVHKVLTDIILETFSRSPVKFTVTEGVRTAERQKALVKAGASKTQNSRHLTGHAADLWPLDASGKAIPSDAAFPAGSRDAKNASDRLWADLRKIAAVAKEVAKEKGVLLEWGGDWGWDAPHFQLNRTAYPA